MIYSDNIKTMNMYSFVPLVGLGPAEGAMEEAT